jgi:hypothetical protein
MKNKLSQNIIRKFIDIININNWCVESESGFVDIKTINKTVQYNEYIIITESGKKLICADTHILILDNNDEVYAKDSLGLNIKTNTGVEKIIAVIPTNKKSNMYDLELADNSQHTYYTNGILSHNTTTYTIYALWLCMFFNEKKIMLLANKADTALEILQRIRLAYEYLPTWLKSSVVIWNKGEIVFSNRSAIKGFATASDAARGFSANCVNKNSIIYIRSKYLKWLQIPIKIKQLKTIAIIQNFFIAAVKKISKIWKR